MKYKKPELEEIELVSASVFLDQSQIIPGPDWGEDEEYEETEIFPEVPVDWSDTENN